MVGKGGEYENITESSGIGPCGAGWGDVCPGDGGAGETGGEPAEPAEHVEQIRLRPSEGRAGEVGGEDAGGKLQFQACGHGAQLRTDRWTPGRCAVRVLLDRTGGEKSGAGHRAHENLQGGSDC